LLANSILTGMRNSPEATCHAVLFHSRPLGNSSVMCALTVHCWLEDKTTRKRNADACPPPQTRLGIGNNGVDRAISST